MLDRKEEHLATGNRPSATARSQGRRRRRRHAHGVRRRVVGHRRRRRGRGLPAAVHLPVPEPPPHAQGRLHQHRPAAPDARARPSAGLLHHRSPDGRARRPREDGSGRVPDQEPAAAKRRTRCGRSYLARGRRRSSAGTSGIRPATRRPGRSRPAWACAVNTWGGGGRGRRRRTARSRPTAASSCSCGTQDLGTGTRTLVAMVAAETLGLPVSAIKPEIGDTMYPFSGGSGGSTTAAAVSPAIRIADGQGARRAEGEGRAGARRRRRRRSSPTDGRIQVKDNPSKGMAWKDACKLHRHRSRSRSTATGSRACRRSTTSAACSSPRSTSTSKPASSR